MPNKDISKRLDELSTQRRAAYTEAQDIITKASSESRELTSDEAGKVDKAQERCGNIDAEARRLQKQLELEGGERSDAPDDETRGGDPLSREPGGEKRTNPNDGEFRFKVKDADGNTQRLTLREFTQAQHETIHSLAFRAYMTAGYERMGHELQTVMDHHARDLPSSRMELRQLEQECAQYGIDLRILQQGSAAAGGYTVPESFYKKMSEAKKSYEALTRAGATVINDSTGADMPMPTSDDTGNTGEIVGETSQAGTQDVAFGSKTMGSFMFSSKIVRAQLQLLQDSAFDLETWLGGKLGERLGRIFATYSTTGNGTTQPEGLMTAIVTGKTTSSTSAITYDELIDLEHSVDEAYRNDPDVALMMHDLTLAVLRKLKDSDGRPIWEPAAQGMPPTINGRRYVINNNMATIAAGAKVMAFGKFSTYHIRNVGRPTMFRFSEKYMDYLQVGFLAYERRDGLLLDPAATAAQSPIKALVMNT